MKNKKLKTLEHKFIDFERKEMPEQFVKKLDISKLFTYRDTLLTEHLYAVDSILEKMEKEKKFFNLEEKVMINRIARFLSKKSCCYFRFVSY